jgi:hypothetical protein
MSSDNSPLHDALRNRMVKIKVLEPELNPSIDETDPKLIQENEQRAILRKKNALADDEEADIIDRHIDNSDMRT